MGANGRTTALSCDEEGTTAYFTKTAKNHCLNHGFRFGFVWFGLIWFGLVWFGPEWF